MEEYVAKNLVRASTTKMAQSRRKQLEKMERIERPVHDTNLQRYISPTLSSLPQDVLKVKGMDISVGEGSQRKTLVDEISFEVRRGEKIGIIGDNGIGKSTLLRIIQEQLPHKGIVRWNSNIKISYFEQESTNLNRELTVMEELHSRYPSMSDLEVRNLLAQVRLVGENVFKETGVISGGERAKLCFAIMMQEHGNVLILDEPTNHLDLSSKEAIEEALEEYTGTIIFVSHDRYLLSKIADRLIELTTAATVSITTALRNIWTFSVMSRKSRSVSQMPRNLQRLPKLQRKRTKKTYRSKQQRSADAARKNEMRRLEKEIDDLQAQIDALTEEIGHGRSLYRL